MTPCLGLLTRHRSAGDRWGCVGGRACEYDGYLEASEHGHSSVMNKMALRPCRFKSATAAPPWLQLLLSQMTNTASPDEGHSAAADGREKHSTPLAMKWHSSAAFEQFAPSSYTVRR